MHFFNPLVLIPIMCAPLFGFAEEKDQVPSSGVIKVVIKEF